MFQQAIENRVQGAEVLVLLPVRQDHGRQIVAVEQLFDGIQVQRGNGVVGYHHHLAAMDMPGNQFGLLQ